MAKKAVIIIIDPVLPKTQVRKGAKLEHDQAIFGKYGAKVVPGKSIQIWKNEEPRRLGETKFGELPGRSFKIGDWAEYDSFNLKYIGQIVQITERGVTIRPRHASKNEGNKRLNLYQFAWRNWNFDFMRAEAENAETSRYI